MDIPHVVLLRYVALDAAVADLLPAIIAQDEIRITADLDTIAKQRNRLVNELQQWKPELRIAAP